ncbi:chromosomal replication initiation ATPase DnaA [Bradyrhizobium sp. GM0.4]
MQSTTALAYSDPYLKLTPAQRRYQSDMRALRLRSNTARLPPIHQAEIDAAWRLIDFYFGNDVSEVDIIIRAVAARFRSVSVRDIRSIRRDRRITEARHMAMYVAKEITSKSFPDLGRRFGGRDHTTVMSAWRKYQRLMLKDADVAQTVAEIIIEVQGASA